jgi:3,5-epimerase/4-reductase
MTVLDDLLPVLIDMALTRKVGTVNLTNPGIISHNEILSMYKEIVDPNFTWENFSIEEQNQILASKRSNNCLDTTLLSSWYTILPIKESVRFTLLRMKEKEELKE